MNRRYIYVLLISSLIFAGGLSEGIIRIFFSKRLVIGQKHMTLSYRYDSLLGWFPKKNNNNKFVGSQVITVVNNSRGFRDQEYQKSAKPSIVFIGDSFVWGYDVEARERFTEKLRALIPGWEVNNLGVSGYGTDQELLLLINQFDYYLPQIVFLVFCSDNDEHNNSSNSTNGGGFYKPYFEITDKNLNLMGVPVPKSLAHYGAQHPWLAQSYMIRLIVKSCAPPLIQVANPTNEIILQMKEFITKKGSQLVVALTQPHHGLEFFLDIEKIPYVQLGSAEKFPSDGEHWTPEGHTTVSKIIYKYLMKNNYLQIPSNIAEIEKNDGSKITGKNGAEKKEGTQ